MRFLLILACTLLILGCSTGKRAEEPMSKLEFKLVTEPTPNFRGLRLRVTRFNDGEFVFRDAMGHSLPLEAVYNLLGEDSLELDLMENFRTGDLNQLIEMFRSHFTLTKEVVVSVWLRGNSKA